MLLPIGRWGGGDEPAQALYRLISRELDGTQVKYNRRHTPPAVPAMGEERTLHQQRQRYWIEHVFQEAQQQWGLHQNQTRSWPTRQRHITLTTTTFPAARHATARARNDTDPLPLTGQSRGRSYPNRAAGRAAGFSPAVRSSCIRCVHPPLFNRRADSRQPA